MPRKISIPLFISYCSVVVLINLCCLADIITNKPYIKILPLGDSITQGEAGHFSYRRPLWKMLDSAGYKVDFIGSLRTNNGGPPPLSDFDLDHEGHYGWRADQLADSLPSWLKFYTPDIVLLHIGTNDMAYKKTIASTVEAIGQIMGILQEAKPNVVQLLALIIPNCCYGVDSLNMALPSLVQRFSKKASPIIIVDQYSGFSVENDLYDGAHPNPDGELKIARKWYNALEPFLIR